ncbi:BadF/BadG/BcrA/BcrD ATPase family protein [Kribbella sp. NPDC050820]|uniref:N-acetylglucosamine kinase n=1 Tax=Kribbella sp. NPDC050820 TaxID=3155408 RepID=UPI00340C3A62
MYLGVDAGNSKTAAILCMSSGKVCGAARSGIGDIYGASRPEEAVDSVVDAVEQAAGESMGDIAGAAFRLAGVDWPEDHAFWVETLSSRLPGLRQVSILNDGFAPIRCIEPSGVGVAVVAGTGPAVAGRGPTQREWSASWWILEPLGAGGMGDRALHAVYRHALGLGPETALTASLLQLYGYDDVEQLRHAFTQRVGSRPWQDKAQAARVVHGLAAAGDAVAVEIVRTQAAHLAEYARTAAVRIGFTPGVDAVPVALSGSVLTAEASPLAEELVRALQVELPGTRPVVTSLPPVAGAVLDAMAEAGVALTPEVIEELRATMPAADLLRT